MYLNGPITFKFPSGEMAQARATSDAGGVQMVGDFLSRGGIPLRADMTPYTRSQILGGELFDGCPINVILDDGRWQQAQLDSLKDPAIAAAVGACRYLPSQAPSQAPAPTATPTQAAQPPAWWPSVQTGGPAFSTGYTPTGITTPTLVNLPGGASYVDPAAAAGAEVPAETVLESGFDALPLVLLLGAGVFLATRKRRRK